MEDGSSMGWALTLLLASMAFLVFVGARLSKMEREIEMLKARVDFMALAMTSYLDGATTTEEAAAEMALTLPSEEDEDG